MPNKNRLRSFANIGISILCIFVLALSGCNAVDKSTAKKALNGSAPDIKKVSNAGEQAFPALFDALEKNTSRDALNRLQLMVKTISEKKDTDQSAPYLRKLLLDNSAPIYKRAVAAYSLSWFFKSKSVQSAIRMCSLNSAQPELQWVCSYVEFHNTRQIANVTKGLINTALDWKGEGWNLPIEVVASAGDKAIPVVFSELKAMPGKTRLSRGSLILEKIAYSQKANSDAPDITKVLLDQHYPSSVRCVAADALRFFPRSKNVKSALRTCAKDDPDKQVRSCCLETLKYSN